MATLVLDSYSRCICKRAIHICYLYLSAVMAPLTAQTPMQEVWFHRPARHPVLKSKFSTAGILQSQDKDTKPEKELYGIIYVHWDWVCFGCGTFARCHTIHDLLGPIDMAFDKRCDMYLEVFNIANQQPPFWTSASLLQKLAEAEQFAVLHGNEQELPWIILNCYAFWQLIAEQPIQAHVNAAKLATNQVAWKEMDWKWEKSICLNIKITHWNYVNYVRKAVPHLAQQHSRLQCWYALVMWEWSQLSPPQLVAKLPWMWAPQVSCEKKLHMHPQIQRIENEWKQQKVV